MKKITMILIFVIFALMGCSNNGETVSPKLDTELKEENLDPIFKEYLENPQVPDDRSLQIVGKSIQDEKGELQLKAYKSLNKQYNIGPIELNLIEAKILHLKPDYSLIDYFHTLTHDEQFYFVKLFVEIKNNSNEDVHFAPIAIMNTNLGEKVTWEKDIYLEDLNGIISDNGRKIGNIGFIIEKDDIDSLEIITSDVFNKEEKKLADAKKINIEF